MLPLWGGNIFCDLNARSLVPVCAAAKVGQGTSFKLSARRVGLATACIVAGSLGFQQAGAVSPGDTRTISLHHVHTNEDLTITYKRNGEYDDAALQKINWILRDWRKNQAIKMDPEEIDLLWEVYRDVGGKEPIHIICGYRSPETNNMLRSRSKGVAKFSQGSSSLSGARATRLAATFDGFSATEELPSVVTMVGIVAGVLSGAA